MVQVENELSKLTALAENFKTRERDLVDQLDAAARELDRQRDEARRNLSKAKESSEQAIARYNEQSAELTKRIALHATREWKEQALHNEARAQLEEAAARLEDESKMYRASIQNQNSAIPFFFAGAVLGITAFAAGLFFSARGALREGDPRAAH